MNRFYYYLYNQQFYLEKKGLYCNDDFNSPFNIRTGRFYILNKRWFFGVPVNDIIISSRRLFFHFFNTLERSKDE